jgi:hypothetical protein
MKETGSNPLSGSVQTQNILHAVNARSFAHYPTGRSQCSLRKRVPAARLVGQLHPLTHGGKKDRVVSHHITTPHRMDADLGGSTGPNDAVATVTQGFLQLNFANVSQNFQ